MALRELPPQVAIVCDACGYAMEHDDITLHFENKPEVIAAAIDDSSWQRRGSYFRCSMCVEGAPAPSTEDG